MKFFTKKTATKVLAALLAAALLLGTIIALPVGADGFPTAVKIGKEPWGVSIAKLPSGTLTSGNIHWYSRANPNGDPGACTIGQIVPVYCLDVLLDSANGMSASFFNNPLARFDAFTLRGLQIIVENGFHVDENGNPKNVPAGMTWREAYVATESAIRYWLGHCGAENSHPESYYAQQEAVAGQEAAFNWRTWLYNEALAKAGNPLTFGITLSPMVFNEVGDNFVATVDVDKHDLDTWAVVNDNLPSGSSISPRAGTTNATITITVPIRPDTTNKTYSIHVSGTSDKMPSNFCWYVPTDPSYQDFLGMVSGIAQAGSEMVQGATPESNGSLSIIKTSQHNDGVVSGFQFEVRNSGNALIGTYTSDATGVIHIPNLRPGIYSVKEINISSDFVEPVPNPKSVEVMINQTASVSFDNIKKRGIITLRKADADPALGGYSLAGAVFEVHDNSGILVDTITTTEDGRAQTKILPLGVYYVTETIAPAGFQRDRSTHVVRIQGSQGSEEIVYAPDVGIAEQPQAGRIRIEKANANSNMGDYSLAGAVFDIYDSGGTIVDTLVTDAAGKAESKVLKLGTYTVKERTAPTGYNLNPTSYPVTLMIVGKGDQSEALSIVTVPENPQPGIIRIYKSNANPGMGNYSLQGAVFEARAKNDIKKLDGSFIYRAGDLVDTITTDVGGEAQTKQLPLGVYTVKEKTAPNGFVVNTTTFDAVLSYAGQTSTIAYADVCVVEMSQVGRINLEKSNATPDLGDYDLANAVFDVFDAGNKLVDTITTDKAGKAQTKDLPLGSYTVKEKSAPYGYVLNLSTYTAKLEYAGQDVTIAHTTVKVPEQPQPGIIRVHKTNANSSMGDYPLNLALVEVRAKYDIKRADGSVIFHAGDLADTIATNAQGYAETKKLPLGTYVVKEVTAPYGYVVNADSFDVTLTYAGQAEQITYSDATVPEHPQVGAITITKLDVSTGDRAQGDATLNGAVFEIYSAADIKKMGGTVIYHKDQLVDTLYCGFDSSATSKELPLGDYYYREKVPPVGYTPDTTVYPITIEYQDQNISVVKKYGDLENKVIQGQIAIVKHSDEPDPALDPPNPQVEQPLEGVIFEVFLKSAGSYDAALLTERDLLTTDADGYAKTKMLPYGLYTVKETYAPGDYRLADPFDVFISAEGKIYGFIVNNPWFRSLVKIVKVDSETGKKIPTAGISFRVKDLSTGEWVSQSFNYPVPTTIEQYNTAADGTLVMPEPLKSGDYELHEVEAPYGYVLTKDPVPFTVHRSQEDHTILEVQMPNAPQKGIIKVEKVGNRLTGTTVIDTVFGQQHTPTFSLTGLKGAVFNVVAAEDITTPDGTTRYTKGQVVDTITTGADGKAETKPLYLGNYELVETTAPHGFVLDETPHPVSLVYAGQEVAVTTSQTGIGNARQLVEIQLQKLMEKPINAPEGFNAFHDVVFGLYSDEDIVGADGSIAIAKDSLVALITLDENGYGVLEGELPLAKYYVREVRTNIFYQLNTTKYLVVAEYKGQDVAVARIQVHNSGTAIPNELKLGRISIEKTGEMLVGARNFDKDGLVYTPTYEVRGVPGVIFDVVASEDVHDVFGKLLHAKGDVVATVTTDENGRATTEPLHLGIYQLVEREVPFGFISDGKPISVSLDFDGQMVDEVLEKHVFIFNVRQKAKLTMGKLMEIPENAEEGYNPYAYLYFGLYSKEDITTVNGEVAIPAGALMEIIRVGANGKANITTDLPFGSYYVKEIATATGYILDDTTYDFAFEYDTDADETIEIAVNGGKPIHNRLTRGSLKVIKVFEGCNVPIAGVPFAVVGHTQVGTTIIINAQTDSNGQIILDDLLMGTYTVTELACELTAGYELAEPQTFIVAGNAVAEVFINNVLQRGGLKVIKTFEGRDTPIEGVPFTIEGKTLVGTDFSGTYYTDANGEITLENLLVGSYTITELASELTVGYALSEAEIIAVAPGRITEMKIGNVLRRGGLKLIKTFEGHTVPIVGIPFLIEGTSLAGMPYSQTHFTDDNGEINIQDLPVGTYAIQELSSELSEGYILSEEQVVEIAADIIAELSLENKLQRGSLKILKQFEGRTKSIAGVPFLVEGTSIAGAVFSETYFTDANGVILVEGLPVGTYTVREKFSEVTKGYLLSDACEITIIADETAELEILNKLQKGGLKLIKTFEGREVPISGVPFRVTGTTAAGTPYDSAFYTDESGVIEVNDLPAGDYSVTELAIQLIEKYVLSKEQAFSIVPGQLTLLEINNVLRRGALKIIKTTDDGKLEGFSFKVEGENYSETFSTNAKGEIFIGDLPVGKYTVTEQRTDASTGYLLPDAVTIEIIEDETLELRVHNNVIEPPKRPPSPKPPYTGDINLAVVITMLVVSAGGVVLLVRHIRKRGAND